MNYLKNSLPPAHKKNFFLFLLPLCHHHRRSPLYKGEAEVVADGGRVAANGEKARFPCIFVATMWVASVVVRWMSVAVGRWSAVKATI